MVGAGFILVLAGIIFLIAALAQWLQNRSYASCSENIKGEVVKKRCRYIKRGAAYELTVSYTIDGIPYRPVVGASPLEYNDVKIGQKIDLKYKPHNPKKAVRPQQLNSKLPPIFFVIGGILFIAGIALLFLR